MTLLACIIPFFNGSATLGRALDSVLASSLCNEVIVVSDASPESLRSCLASQHLESESEGRLRLVELAGNVGQGAARNIGASLSRAACLSFLDQDDEILPSFHVQALACLQQHQELAAVEVGAEIVGPSGPLLGGSDPRYPLILASVPWNVIVRRSAFWACGGFPVEPIFRTEAAGEDIAFKSALKASFSVNYLDVHGIRHHVRPDSATDRFLRRTTVTEAGTVVFSPPYAVEQDGSLAAALRHHVACALENRQALALMQRAPR